MGTKGARITSHVSLPAATSSSCRTVEHVGVSRKIVDEEERRRLKTILRSSGRSGAGAG